MWHRSELLAEQPERHSHQFDIVVVHHWWLTQYVAYYYSRPEQVHGLGALLRREASIVGEQIASLQDLARLSGADRVLLMVNELAIEHTDRPGSVISKLRQKRPIVLELPCLANPEAGPTLFCTRLVLFGAERSAAQPPTRPLNVPET